MIRVIILVLDIYICVCWVPHIIVLLILIIMAVILSLKRDKYLGCIYFSEKPLLPNINLFLGLSARQTRVVGVINGFIHR